MLERNPVVAALLDDAWRVVMRMRKSAAGCRSGCSNSRLQPDGADRYYPTPAGGLLDPMFPHKQKSALVKKEMRAFSRWWGRILMPMDY